MCTYIVETATLAGSAKGPQGWFDVDHATISYDHPFHAPVEHALMVDFVDGTRGIEGRRVAVELTLDGARELVRALSAAIARATEYEAAAARPK
jgi:Family of unknown function (DUF6295)